MLTRPDIARDPYGVEGETPRGFLPAAALLVAPGDPEYLREVDTILAQVGAELEGYGISATVTLTPAQRRGALALAKSYAAEAVLMRSQTGTVKDPEGASMSLSGADLAHWERIRDRAERDAERFLGSPVKPRVGSGVFFAPTNLGQLGGKQSHSHKELSEDY